MIELVEPDPGSWERFCEGLLRAGDGEGAGVVRAWARARGYGLPADGAAPPEGVHDTDLQVRRDASAAVLDECANVLGPLAEALSSRGVLALFADRDGVIVDAIGGGAFRRTAAETRLVEGARWDELSRGTNAIGTALAEGAAVAVIGGAHYERANHALFCYAAPVRDAYGDVVGVLDVSGPVAAHDRVVGVAVQAAASAIEKALRLRAYAQASAGGLRLVERLVAAAAGAAVVFEATGVARVANDRARRRFGAALDGEGAVARVLGVSWRELVASAEGPASPALARRCERQGLRVELEAIHGVDGRALAVVALFSDAPRIAVRPARAVTSEVNPAFEAILGGDAALVRARADASRFARTALPVLLLAETGTGKELFARAIHAASAAARGPFVAVNCGALSPSLLESELFGYGDGAFTGARRGGSDGRLAAADGGTLFLDEVAEMPDALQAALLRALEDGSYTRVGEARPRRSRFRLVAATCRDLVARVREGAFRKDLFFRIQGAVVTLPALRDRTDKVELARALLARQAARDGAPARSLSPDAERWVEEHDWPGNVRELVHALDHAVALSDGAAVLEREHLPAPLFEAAAGATASRRDALKGALEQALDLAQGNMSDAARRLGVARSTLYRMIERYLPDRVTRR